MSIAFTSLLLIPPLAKILKNEEKYKIKTNCKTLKQFYTNYKEIFKIYIFIFLGIFMAYSLTVLFTPELTTINLFSTQLKSTGLTGNATQFQNLQSILLNNLTVLLVSFILAFIYGAGAIIFLAWNASVWGVIIAFFAKQVTFVTNTNPFVEFFLSMIPLFPHLITEAIAYITAAIIGGIISQATLNEKMFSKKFNRVLKDASAFLIISIALVIIAALIEVYLY